jgi:ParB family chromosome partitioning protein
MQKLGLGKGLGALISSAEPAERSGISTVDVNRIHPNPLQPRRAFDEEALRSLAESLREKGLIQPLVVRRRGNDFELIAGERRLRAAVRAGFKEVPVVVREAQDQEALHLALIENLQREDLNPIEEAVAYRSLQEEFGLSQEEIAQKVGKSRSAVANTVRLLLLPKEIQSLVAEGKLAAGQARALLGLDGEALILTAAREVVGKGLSTRATERLVGRIKFGRKKVGRAASADADLRDLVERLQRSLGTKVRVVPKGNSGQGKIEIQYHSKAEFDRLFNNLCGQGTSRGAPCMPL